MTENTVIACENDGHEVSRVLTDEGAPLHPLDAEELATSRFLQWRDDRYVVGKLYARMSTRACKRLALTP